MNTPAEQPAGEPVSTEPQIPAAGVPSRRMIPVADLAAHPGNVRRELSLTPEFTASIAAEGVRTRVCSR